MMMRFVADVEIGLTQEDVDRFSSLSQQLNMDFPQCVVMCMRERRDELLEGIKKNIPDAEEIFEEKIVEVEETKKENKND